MTGILRTIALALLVAFLPQQASAVGTAWVDPEGVFSIDVGAPNWSVAQRAEHPDWFFEDFVVLAYSGLEGGGPRNLCYALIDTRSPAPNPGSNVRERMNAATRQLEHSPTIAAMREDDRFDLERVEVTEIDGVAVLDVYGRFGSLQTVQRRFFVYRDSEIRMYILSCSVVASEQDAVAASRAIAASLRIPGGGEE
jgi:hypothetical protein